jgi:hypothetical protein
VVALHPPVAAFRPAARAPAAREVPLLVRRGEILALEWKPLLEFGAVDWARVHDLIGRALQPNVFYEPAFMRAAADLPMTAGMGALLVSSGAQLVGMLVGRVESLARGRPVPTFVAWELPYAPLSTPLLDREAADAAAAEVLRGLPLLPGAPRLALFRLIDDGPTADVLADRLYSEMKQPRVVSSHPRAALFPGAGDPFPVSRRRRKEFGRLRRRLAEVGTLKQEIVRGEVASALATFLALEASGWKGRAGTAAQDDPAVIDFLAGAVTGLAREGKAQVHLLKLGGRPIAAAIVLFSGARAWFWKTAYDEHYAHFSPGVLNALDLTIALSRDPRLALVDSCAIAHHPMIDRLWGGRLRVANWLVPLAGRRSLMVGFAAEKLRHLAIEVGKSARNHLRRR